MLYVALSCYVHARILYVPPSPNYFILLGFGGRAYVVCRMYIELYTRLYVVEAKLVLRMSYVVSGYVWAVILKE